MKLIVSTETYKLLLSGSPEAAEVTRLLTTAARENAPLEGDAALPIIERAVCPPHYAWGHPDGDETGFLLDLTTGRKVNLFLCGSFWDAGTKLVAPPEPVVDAARMTETGLLPPRGYSPLVPPKEASE